MHAQRAPKPRTTRLVAGLAAAALGVGGIAGLAAPAQAAAGDYPYDLAFEPTQVLAAGDAVFAIGREQVAKVGAAPIDLGAGTSVSDAALTPDGSALHVLGDAADGTPQTWTVDTTTLAVQGPAPIGGPAHVLGTDSKGMFTAGFGVDGELRYDATELIHFGDDGSDLSDAEAMGEAGHRTWFVGGQQWDQDGGSAATLWRVSEATGAATDLVLGAPASPDARVTAVAVDPAAGTAYVASDDPGDGTQGVTVVHGGDTTYVPLDRAVEDLAVSANGETLYLSDGYRGSAVPTAALNSGLDLSWSWRHLGVWNASVAAGSTGELYAAGGTDAGAGQVVRFATPAAPTKLTAAPDAYSTETLAVSWDEGKYSWERETAADYMYAVFEGTPSSTPVTTGETSDQVVYVDGLTPGTTYTVVVARVDGPLPSEPIMATVTTYPRHVGAPSAVAIEGSLTVGSTLSAVATGAWEDGAEVTYEWFGTLPDAQSSGPVIATGPTLPLTAAHLDMAIYVVATGTKPGVATVSLASAPNLTARVANPAPPVVPAPPAPAPPAPAPVVPKTLTAATPKISGKAKVGETLSAQPGSWTAGAKLTYQWEADGKPIKHATKRTLQVTSSLKGQRISVTVSGSLTGYPAASRTSAETDRVAGAAEAGSKPGKGKPGKGDKGKGDKGKPGKPGKDKPGKGGKDKPGKGKPGKPGKGGKGGKPGKGR